MKTTNVLLVLASGLLGLVSSASASVFSGSHVSAGFSYIDADEVNINLGAVYLQYEFPLDLNLPVAIAPTARIGVGVFSDEANYSGYSMDYSLDYMASVGVKVEYAVSEMWQVFVQPMFTSMKASIEGHVPGWGKVSESDSDEELGVAVGGVLQFSSRSAIEASVEKYSDFMLLNVAYRFTF